MEELSAVLLGYQSGIVTADGSLSPELLESIHPVELAIVQSALPLGKRFESLTAFVDEWRMGRIRDALLAGFAKGMEPVLDDYAETVLNVATPTDVSRLLTRFWKLFDSAVAIVQCGATADRTQLITKLVMCLDTPADLRGMLARECSQSVLMFVAHWVAHGLFPNADTFIAPHPTRGDQPATEPSSPAAGGASSAAVVDAKRLPLGMSARLAALILRAGLERRVLRYEHPDAAPPTEMAQDADGSAAAQVFQSLFDPASLLSDGLVVWGKLEARVATAKVRWSDTLWKAVRQSCHLNRHLDVLRDCFLCHNGELWFGFVESAFPVICSLNRTIRENTNVELRVARLFKAALTASGLGELRVYQTCSMLVAGGGGFDTVNARSHEETGRLLIQRIRRLSLSCVFAPGVGLIIDDVDVRRYTELFTLQVMIKFSQHALQLAHRAAMMVDKRSATPMAPALLVFMSLVQQILAFLACFSQVLHTDVVEPGFTALVHQLSSVVQSAEAGRKVHSAFVSSVVRAAFLEGVGPDVKQAVEAACILSLALYSFAEVELGASALLQGSRGNRANEDVQWDAALLKGLQSLVRRHVLEPISKRVDQELSGGGYGPDGGATVDATSVTARSGGSSLWTRLDGNQWFTSRRWERHTATSAAVLPTTAGPQPTYRRAADRAAPQLSAATRAKVAATRLQQLHPPPSEPPTT